MGNYHAEIVNLDLKNKKMIKESIKNIHTQKYEN